MSNSTPEFTDVDGVSLQTMVQNLKTWGGSREAPPPVRGEDALIPNVPGELFLEKQPGARTITLDGWVLGMDKHLTVEAVNVATNPDLVDDWGTGEAQYVDGGFPGDTDVTTVIDGVGPDFTGPVYVIDSDDNLYQGE